MKNGYCCCFFCSIFSVLFWKQKIKHRKWKRMVFIHSTGPLFVFVSSFQLFLSPDISDFRRDFSHMVNEERKKVCSTRVPIELLICEWKKRISLHWVPSIDFFLLNVSQQCVSAFGFKWKWWEKSERKNTKPPWIYYVAIHSQQTLTLCIVVISLCGYAVTMPSFAPRYCLFFLSLGLFVFRFYFATSNALLFIILHHILLHSHHSIIHSLSVERSYLYDNGLEWQQHHRPQLPNVSGALTMVSVYKNAMHDSNHH